ncbi:pyrimidine 5'-nucleotidase [Bosea sp. TAF32]|uniref:pyrimidine 5'-nucleotidase n=1 Tax=Bosea sp. TAF32 TaxID=3237482 RepID=UPI003F93AEC7
MKILADIPAAAPPFPTEGFAHVDHWIFDLDNTLYSHEAKVWPQVDERITLFLAELFGLDGLSSRALQKYYYQHYGTTLKGLMEEHGVDPGDFLDFAHQIDLTLLDPNPDLGEAIAALPGRKLILTNGSRGHAENVAGKLGILHHFEDIFDIVQAGFTPKPERSTYETFLAKHSVDPGRAAMFEDIEKNLVVPSALGMKTVLIVPKTPDPFRETWEQVAVEAGHVHHVTADLTGFLKPLGRPTEPCT